MKPNRAATHFAYVSYLYALWILAFEKPTHPLPGGKGSVN